MANVSCVLNLSNLLEIFKAGMPDLVCEFKLASTVKSYKNQRWWLKCL